MDWRWTAKNSPSIDMRLAWGDFLIIFFLSALLVKFENKKLSGQQFHTYVNSLISANLTHGEARARAKPLSLFLIWLATLNSARTHMPCECVMRDFACVLWRFDDWWPMLWREGVECERRRQESWVFCLIDEKSIDRYLLHVRAN